MLLGHAPISEQSTLSWRQLRDGWVARLGFIYPMLRSAAGLLAGKASTMVLGFLAWLLAARLFPASEVGLAAGTISAMMLCVQVSLLGVGTAVIGDFPKHREHPAKFLNTAFSLVTGTSFLAACLYLLAASRLFNELKIVISTFVYVFLFLVLTITGATGVLYDQISTALHRGDETLLRSIIMGVVTLAWIGIIPLTFGLATSITIFWAWAVGGVIYCVIGAFQLWKSLSGYWFWPMVDFSMGKRLLKLGFPNYVLTMLERAPGVILPIFVTEFISPTANAYWYTVWMIAWAIYLIPNQTGLALFAEAARQQQPLRKVVRVAVQSSLVVGIAGALIIGLLAYVLLSMLGHNYANEGVMPLRILVLTAIPYTFIQAYFATCRATRKLDEAIWTGLVSGVISITGVVLAGMNYGLLGMAAAWLALQVLISVWAAWRLYHIQQSDPVVPLALAG